MNFDRPVNHNNDNFRSRMDEIDWGHGKPGTAVDHKLAITASVEVTNQEPPQVVSGSLKVEVHWVDGWIPDSEDATTLDTPTP